MKFNPLWLIFLLFFFSGGWIFLLPLLFVFLILGGGLILGGASGGLARLPGQWWKLLTDRRRRADIALGHAVAQLVRARGVFVTAVWGEPSGFFLTGVGDESGVYELAVQALARLKNGERALAIDPYNRVFRWLAGSLTALILASPSLALGPIGLVLAAAAGYFAAPYLSPWLQSLLLSGAPVEELTVQNARFQRRVVKSMGGRFTGTESGVEVSTSRYAADTIEAEIVEE